MAPWPQHTYAHRPSRQSSHAFWPKSLRIRLKSSQEHGKTGSLVKNCHKATSHSLLLLVGGCYKGCFSSVSLVPISHGAFHLTLLMLQLQAMKLLSCHGELAPPWQCCLPLMSSISAPSNLVSSCGYRRLTPHSSCSFFSQSIWSHCILTGQIYGMWPASLELQYFLLLRDNLTTSKCHVEKSKHFKDSGRFYMIEKAKI